jgi:hypothetical protein
MEGSLPHPEKLTQLMWGQLSKEVIHNCEGGPEGLRKRTGVDQEVLEEELEESLP